MPRKRQVFRLPETRINGSTKRSGLSSPTGDLPGLGDIEQLAKNLAVGAIALYVLGLVAVNGYLFQLNVSDFTLVKTRFIYTGTLIAGYLIAPYAISRYLFGKFHEKWRGVSALSPFGRNVMLRRRLYLIANLSLDLLLFPMALTFLFMFLTDRYIRDGYLLAVQAAAAAGFIPYLGGLLFALIIHRGVRPMRESVKKVGWLPSFGFAIVGLAYLLALFIYIFMSTIYDELPEQFGGGRPTPIRLLVKSDMVGSARELGIPISADRNLSDQVSLVYTGNDSYVIRLEDGTILQLDKTMVAAAMTRKG